MRKGILLSILLVSAGICFPDSSIAGFDKYDVEDEISGGVTITGREHEYGYRKKAKKRSGQYKDPQEKVQRMHEQEMKRRVMQPTVL